MNPGYFLGCFLEAWLAALAALIFYRILTGQITLNGLFTMDGERFSPERLQLLLITVGILAWYVQDALGSNAMPTPSNDLLVILGASHFVYIGGKVAGR
jgi:hypothetical protein